MKKSLYLIAALLFMVSSAQAWNGGGTEAVSDTSKTKKKENPEVCTECEDDVTKSTKKKDDEGEFTFSGYVDTYYQYNFNDPVSRGNAGRIFDIAHDNFSLGLVQTAFGYTTPKSEVFVDLTFGPNAELGNFGNTIFSDGSSALSIKQAYFAYNISDKVKFTVGQYGTHIGYELIDAPANFNYSLSYLFGNGPFYHTGAKFDFSISDNFGFMVGVVNGWDALLDFNDKKSLTAQVFFAPVDGWDVYVNWIGGDEYDGVSAFGETEGSFTSLFDLTTTFQATDEFLIGLNAAYGTFATGADAVDDNDPYSKDADWGGVALYLNYAFSDAFGLGLRTEFFEDYSGIRYPGTPGFSSFSTTLTGDIKLDGGRFNIKPELRLDSNNADFFDDSDGALSSSMFTAGVAFIYSFSK